MDRGSRAGWARLDGTLQAETGQLAAPNEKVSTKRQPSLLDRQEVGPARLTWTGLDTRLLNRATGRARAQGGRSVASSPIGRRTESEHLQLVFKNS